MESFVKGKAGLADNLGTVPTTRSRNTLTVTDALFDAMEEENRRTTLSEVFLDLRLPRNARILDVACGTGIVAEELRQHGYDNIDGLDPVKGYLETAQDKKLYRVCRGFSLHLTLSKRLCDFRACNQQCFDQSTYIGFPTRHGIFATLRP